MSEDAKTILKEIEELKRSVREIQLTLENETNRNIKIIAEKEYKGAGTFT